MKVKSYWILATIREKKNTENHKSIIIDNVLIPVEYSSGHKKAKFALQALLMSSFNKATLNVQLLPLSKQSIEFWLHKTEPLTSCYRLCVAARTYKPQHSCQRNCGVTVRTNSLGAVINPHHVVCSCLQSTSLSDSSGNQIQVPVNDNEPLMFSFLREGGITKFLCQVALGPQFPLVVFIVVIALQGLAVILHQGELGANERQLDGTATRQGLNRIFKCCEEVNYTQYE